LVYNMSLALNMERGQFANLMGMPRREIASNMGFTATMDADSTRRRADM